MTDFDLLGFFLDRYSNTMNKKDQNYDKFVVTNPLRVLQKRVCTGVQLMPTIGHIQLFTTPNWIL